MESSKNSNQKSHLDFLINVLTFPADIESNRSMSLSHISTILAYF